MTHPPPAPARRPAERLEVADGTGFDFLRIVELSPGELEETVYSLYQRWLLLARMTAQRMLQVMKGLYQCCGAGLFLAGSTGF